MATNQESTKDPASNQGDGGGGTASDADVADIATFGTAKKPRVENGDTKEACK